MQDMRMNSVLASLKQSNQYLENMKVYEEEEETFCFSHEKVEKVSKPTGKKSLLIRDVIEDKKATTFPMQSIVLDVSIGSPKFANVLTTWQEAHPNINVVSISSSADQQKVIVNYTHTQE